MADLVALSEIEQIVGVERWHSEHVGLASLDGCLYILHSHDCLRELGHHRLTECRFSEALDDMKSEQKGEDAARRVGATPLTDVWGPWRDLRYVNVPVLLGVEMYGQLEGKGVPWYRLVPAGRLPRVYVPRANSLVRNVALESRP